MRTIELTQGFVAVVDDADYAAVSAHKWYAQKDERRVYAARKIRHPDGRRDVQFLHQFLIPGAVTVDHKDGNCLNDRRDNLRPATQRQNQQGFKTKRAGATSKFRGVSWNVRLEKWVAQIQFAGRVIYLGLFVEEESAARAYDTAARQHFGEFASPNFS